ncbi:MAG: hypothetical protein OXR68_06405 [Alphaproteobacteria bacterium]|nr:hypothetical protein [Alphaproteobacteria bacterium]MDD9920237.1 hypothetical protein [Alphaproteobacteria bacterium]
MSDNMILIAGVGVILLFGYWFLRHIIPLFQYIILIIIGAAVLTLYQSDKLPW